MQLYLDTSLVQDDEDVYLWRRSTLALLKKLACLEVPSTFRFGHDKNTLLRIAEGSAGTAYS
jgi:hypothetical protein